MSRRTTTRNREPPRVSFNEGLFEKAPSERSGGTLNGLWWLGPPAAECCRHSQSVAAPTCGCHAIVGPPGLKVPLWMVGHGAKSVESVLFLVLVLVYSLILVVDAIDIGPFFLVFALFVLFLAFVISKRSSVFFAAGVTHANPTISSTLDLGIGFIFFAHITRDHRDYVPAKFTEQFNIAGRATNRLFLRGIRLVILRLKPPVILPCDDVRYHGELQEQTSAVHAVQQDPLGTLHAAQFRYDHRERLNRTVDRHLFVLAPDPVGEEGFLDRHNHLQKVLRVGAGIKLLKMGLYHFFEA